MTYIEALPAYGREYKNQSQVKADWNDNKDFHVPFSFSTSSGYINKQDAEQMKVKVIVRYAKGMKVLAVN